MIQLMKEYPADAVAIAIGVVIVIALVAMNRIDALRKAALIAVSVAEEKWGAKTGEIKYAEVVFYLKSNFKILTIFFSDAQLGNIIEMAIIKMKEVLLKKQESAKIVIAKQDKE